MDVQTQTDEPPKPLILGAVDIAQQGAISGTTQPTASTSVNAQTKYGPKQNLHNESSKQQLGILNSTLSLYLLVFASGALVTSVWLNLHSLLPYTFDLVKALGPAAIVAWLSVVTLNKNLKSRNEEMRVQQAASDGEWVRQQAKEAQLRLDEWYFEYAITGCTQPILTEIQRARRTIGLRGPSAKKLRRTQTDTAAEALNEACARLTALTASDNLTFLFGVLDVITIGEADNSEMEPHLRDPELIQAKLNGLQRIILDLQEKLMADRITTHAEIHKLRNKPYMIHLCSLINRNIESITRGAPITSGITPFSEAFRAPLDASSSLSSGQPEA